MAIPMSRVSNKNRNDGFYRALLSMRTEEECYKLLSDVCTMAEMRAFEQRFEVACMLKKGAIYSEIKEKTGASSATISRVARSLTYSEGGYALVFERMSEAEEAEQGESAAAAEER